MPGRTLRWGSCWAASPGAPELREVKGIATVSITDTESGPRIDLDLDPEQGMPVSEIPSRLITQGYRVSEIHQEQVNLETAFMRLTKGIVS